MIENKTKNIMAEVRKIMSEIEDNGGSMNCIISGYQQKMIHESAWKHMKNVENKDIEVVGVNKYEENDKEDFEAQRLDINNSRKQIIHLQELKKNRNEDAIKIALQELSRVCKSEENIMDSIISAVKAEATVGEINNVMKDVFGTWISPSGV